MKKHERDFIISLTQEIVQSEAPEEEDLLLEFSGSMLEEVLSGDTDSIYEHSHFGGEASIFSYYLIGIIAWISTSIASEGIVLAKVAMQSWLKENKPRLIKKYSDKNHLKAIEVLEKYLEK